MQPLVLAPGAIAEAEMVAPASLSEMATVPALKELEGFAVVAEKLDQVAAATATAASPQTRRDASSFRATLIECAGWRSEGSRRRSGPGSPCAWRREARRSRGAAAPWRLAARAVGYLRSAVRRGSRHTGCANQRSPGPRAAGPDRAWRAARAAE